MVLVDRHTRENLHMYLWLPMPERDMQIKDGASMIRTSMATTSERKSPSTGEIRPQIEVLYLTTTKDNERDRKVSTHAMKGDRHRDHAAEIEVRGRATVREKAVTHQPRSGSLHLSAQP
jgi:hypothetical protein